MFQKLNIVGGSLCVALLLNGALRVAADPTDSPSVIRAARLKYAPPKNYVRHYLPDDRYKIGSAWKVVSTESDTLYHRPNCPRMLRQSAGGVIGFSSAGDAVEAGYEPCSVCRPQLPKVTYAKPSASRQGGGSNLGDGSAPITLDIPESAIPKHISAFIRLVDGLADDIDRASSSGELFQIRARLARLTSAFTSGAVAQYIGTGAVPSADLRQMIGILQTLDNAARTKGAGDPTGIGAQLYGQLTRSARASADDSIPQVRAVRERMNRLPEANVNVEGVMSRYRATSRAGH